MIKKLTTPALVVVAFAAGLFTPTPFTGPEVPDLPVVGAFAEANADSNPWRMLVVNGDTLATSAGKTYFDDGYSKEFAFAWWPVDAELRFWPMPTHYVETWTGDLTPPPKAERDYWWATDPIHPTSFAANLEVRIYDAKVEPHKLLKWYDLTPDSTCADYSDCIDVVEQPDPDPDPGVGPKLTTARFQVSWTLLFSFEDSVGSQTSSVDPATVAADDFVLTRDGEVQPLGSPVFRNGWYFTASASEAPGAWKLLVKPNAVADLAGVFNSEPDSLEWTVTP